MSMPLLVEALAGARRPAAPRQGAAQERRAASLVSGSTRHFLVDANYNAESSI